MKKEENVQRIKKQILELGPMLPGSLSEQWKVCGTAGCKCLPAITWYRLRHDPDPMHGGPYPAQDAPSLNAAQLAP